MCSLPMPTRLDLAAQLRTRPRRLRTTPLPTPTRRGRSLEDGQGAWSHSLVGYTSGFLLYREAGPEAVCLFFIPQHVGQ